MSYLTKLKLTKDQQNVVDSFPRGEGYVLTVANSKGGVGKTTISNLLAYHLSEMGLKVLIIDADRQANATKTMLLTKAVINDETPNLIVKKSFMAGLKDQNLEDAIVPIKENLDLIPSAKDTKDFPRHLYLNINNQIDRDYFLHDSIRKVQFYYDVVIIDSPPNNEEIIRNVSVASDYILVAYEPAEHSTSGAEDFKDDILTLQEDPLYSVKLELLGVIPSKVKRGSRTDDYMMHYMENKSRNYSKDDLYNSVIYLMERVKQFDITGITNDDTWDEYVHEKYQEVALETIERILAKRGEMLNG